MSKQSTLWSSEMPCPSGLPFMPDGRKWCRMIRGKLVVVTRQVPPGIKIVSGSAKDHPHSLRWCLWVGGEFRSVVASIEQGFLDGWGSLFSALAAAEESVGCPSVERTTNGLRGHGGSGGLLATCKYEQPDLPPFAGVPS